MYYSSNKPKRIKIRITLILGIILIISLFLTIFFEIALFPTFADYCESKLQTTLLNQMNLAVSDVLEEDGVSYNNLTEIARNGSNIVSSVEVNTVLINRLKSRIALVASDLVDKTEDVSLKVPLGTLFGNTMLSGRGPDVNVRFKTTSSVFVHFESKFSDAGINQTLHQIIVNIKCDAYLVFPMHKRKTSVDTNVLIAQAVIVGDVPENYTEVIEVGDATDDSVANIFDYGTIND